MKKIMTVEMVAVLEKFINEAKASVEKQTDGRSSLTIKAGSVFVKVLLVNVPTGGHSAWCFIDKETGQIFKPASFSTPAKGARGNIMTTNASKLDWAGGSFYR